MTLNFSGESVVVPIREYQRDRDLTSVALVPMVHWADPQFYEEVKKYVAYRESDEGSGVHYESIDLPPEELNQAVTDKELGLLAKIAVFGTGVSGSSTKKMFEGAGLVSQLEHIKPGKHWERHDVSLTDLVRDLGVRETIYPHLSNIIGRVVTVAQTQRGKNPRAQIISSINKSIRQAEGLEEKDGFADWLDGDLEYEVIGKRNAIALKAVAQHLQNHPTKPNLTLLWGAAHMNGIGDGLLDMGFELVRELPLTAISSEVA